LSSALHDQNIEIILKMTFKEFYQSFLFLQSFGIVKFHLFPNYGADDLLIFELELWDGCVT